MTYQSRTRNKSITDLSDYIQNLGVCCYPDGTKSDDIPYSDCISASGYFVLGKSIGDVSCINPGATGCCCACSFVEDMDSFQENYSAYMGGLQSNTTECDCIARGGSWSEGVDCSEFNTSNEVKSFCRSVTTSDPPIVYDVRFPGACCQEEFNDSGELIGYICTETCTGSECKDLNGVVYYGIDWGGSGKLCERPRADINFLQPADCETSAFDSPCDGACCGQKHNGEWKCKSLNENDCYEEFSENSDYLSSCWHGCNTECLIEGQLICELNPECRSASTPLPDDDISACCVLNSAGTAYSCSDRMTQTECETIGGIWAGLTGDMPIYCGSNPCPNAPRSATDSGDVSGRNNSPSVSQSEINKLNIGDEYAGGIFMGVFEPGTPINGKGSIVSGNQFTGKVQEYESRGFGTGSKNNKKWAIIIDTEDTRSYSDSLTSPNKISPTSYFDGHYNLYGNNATFYGLNGTLADSISKMTKRGYADWYIPSQDESAYLHYTFSNTDYGNSLQSGENEKYDVMSGTYITSTLFSHKDATNQEKRSIDKQDIEGSKYLYSQEFQGRPRPCCFYSGLPNDEIFTKEACLQLVPSLCQRYGGIEADSCMECPGEVEQSLVLNYTTEPIVNDEIISLVADKNLTSSRYSVRLIRRVLIQ